MSRFYVLRQAALAGLGVNAIRPLMRGEFTAIPSFFAGWLAGELAPQLLAVSVADTAQAVLRRRAKPAELALGAAAAGILGTLVYGSLKTPALVEEALVAGLGENYADPTITNPEDRRVAAAEVARPFRLRSHAVEVHRGLPYTEGGSRALMDIYKPRDVDLENAPVLLQVHGGGWTIGNKEEQGLILMNRMAERGWICVAINYRLAPKHLWPAQIIDVKRALAWVHEHIAEYGGDPNYVVITGGSAGGHLSALAALADNTSWQPGFESADTSVAACVPFYGVYDMAGMTGDREAIVMRDSFLAPWVFKKDPKTDLDDFVQASPIAHVGPHAPDFFVIHGANDTLVSVKQARKFVEALRDKSNATVTYAELPGTQHAFDVFSSIRSQHVARAVQRWLELHRANWLARAEQSLTR